MEAPKISRELRDRLEGLIGQWRQTTAKPPCTLGQLVVMVLLLGTPCTRGEIFSRILTSSGYHAMLASSRILGGSSYFDSDEQAVDITTSAQTLSWDLHDVFNEFDIPLVHLRDNDNGREMNTVSSNEARMMLSPLLEANPPTSARPFPFMRLPTELREIIYDMVMTLPKSGVVVSTQSRGTSLEVYSRNHKTETGIQDPTGMYSLLKAHPLRYYLDVLLACRQIFQEALPIFYKRNNFLFSSQAVMERKLQVLTVERCNHIEHLSFRWNHTSKTQAERCFKRLAKMPFLRRLDIHIDEKDWTTGVTGEEPFHLSAIHGFTILRSIRGLEAVNFFGDCENVKDALAKKLVGPEEGKQKQKAGVKRKASKDIKGTEEAEGHERPGVEHE